MKIRARILRRDPICVECKAKGRVTSAAVSTVVDHIVPLTRGGSNDDSNLQGMCKDCHDAKTMVEAGRRPRYAQRQRIGADGWPIDD